jgi:multidrug efflux pump subunit AcrB
VAALIWFFGRPLGTEIFPAVDAGQFQLRLRAPTGTRIEWTEQLMVQALDGIAEAAGKDNVATSLGWVGVVPSAFPINAVYLFNSGPEEAVFRVALKPGSGVRVAELQERLRTSLPKKLGDWFRQKLVEEKIASDEIDKRVQAIRLSFEPADIVSEVMSFGAPTPVEIAISGAKLAADKSFADKLRTELSQQAPGLRDLQYVQPLDYPTIDVTIDRERAGLSGVTAQDVSRSLLTATWSSRFVVPNFWRDPASGIGYQVQVQVPPPQMTTAGDVARVPVKRNGTTPMLVRDVADVKPGSMPGEYDRYNMRRLVSLTANIAGTDLGRVADQVDAAIKNVGDPPTGVEVAVRGQIEPMRQMFRGLNTGLLLTVMVILLLLTAYFQSIRLALVALATVPAVVAGVALALFVTRTTINIQSFMGAIMAIGVAVANAILLVTFAERIRRDGHDARYSAANAARSRARPILMTSFAMMAGMLPMALGFGEGGEQTAPLGRAVIGGLAAATVTALFILPAIFALVMGGAPTRSASLDPDDPDSRHFQSAT